MHDVPIGPVTVGTGYPLTIIAGPCVAESQGLCEDVCGALQRTCRALGLSYVFKASYDKANRMSAKSFRGPGLAKGLKWLARVKQQFRVPLLTDIHHPEEAALVAKVAEVVQIPALLIRQTDLLLAAARTKRVVNLKKGQFMAPDDMAYAVEKVERAGNQRILVTERGTTFGYHQLVVDMRSLRHLRAIGYPVVFDASHSAQQPGAGRGQSGGNRDDVGLLAKAATAAGIQALFFEVHPRPNRAKSDAATQIDLRTAERLLKTVAELHAVAHQR